MSVCLFVCLSVCLSVCVSHTHIHIHTATHITLLLLFCHSMGSIPELDFLHQDTVIVLNVGGQIFETTVAVLTADPFSVLACLCRRDCPVPHQGGGEAAAATDLLLSSQPREFFLDRDWWIFRHVLSFLRSDLLPSDLDTLKELYKEAIYYRIQSLQKAIENFPMNQVQES